MTVNLRIYYTLSSFYFLSPATLEHLLAREVRGKQQTMAMEYMTIILNLEINTQEFRPIHCKPKCNTI